MNDKTIKQQKPIEDHASKNRAGSSSNQYVSESQRLTESVNDQYKFVEFANGKNERTELSASQWPIGYKLLDRYIVRDILGQGGMGTVYLVELLSSKGDFFAVKTLLHSALDNPKKRRLFLRELRTWIDLPLHPNLAACRFCRTIDDRLAIFSEFVPGGSLRRWIQTSRISSMEQILDIAIQIAWALQAAHDRNVIHQDIKPSNVLMTNDGIAKVTDFGLARACFEGGVRKSSSTSTSFSKYVSTGGMTLAYCSPEQAMFNKLTFTTDIWSWGVSILEMLLEKVTWRYGYVAAAVIEGLKNQPVTPRGFPIPQRFIDVLDRCFQENPDDRWKNMEDAADNLMEIYNESSGTIYPRQKPVVTDDTGSMSVPYERMMKGTGVTWDDPQKWLEKGYREANKSLDVLRALPARGGSGKAQILTDLEIYEDAALEFRRLVNAGREDLREDFVSLLINKASVHRSIEDYPGAVALFDEATGILDQLLQNNPSSNNANKLASVYISKGNCLHSQHQYNEAVILFDQAIAIRETLTGQSSDPNTQDNLATVYICKANTLFVMGELKRALIYYDKTIMIREKIMEENYSAVNADELAKAYMNKGTLLRNLGDFNEAMVLFDKALAVREKLADKHGLMHYAFNLAQVYINKANLKYMMGYPAEAITHYDLSIAIVEGLVHDNGRWELADQLVKIYVNKANAIKELQKIDDSLTLYDKSIAIRKRLIFQEGRTDLLNELANVLFNKGILVYECNDLVSAGDLFNEAFQIKERLVFEENRQELMKDLARIHVYQAHITRDRQQLENALILYEKAASIIEELIRFDDRTELKPDIAEIQAFLAHTYQLSGDSENAVLYANKAIDVLNKALTENGRKDLLNALTLAQRCLGSTTV
ncbi:serine/threonine protein kinase [bacterium]|nr:serine/threonine protein kinase [candidate division CSSED10-310 bacterium]